MLLLVTVALVFAGLVLLIVGFVQDSLSLIYLSIACAAVAGIALIVFSRLSRRRAVRLALEGVPAAAAPPSPLLNRPRMADDAADRRLRPAARQQAPVYDDAEQRAPQPATARAVFPGEFADDDDVTERQPAMRPAPQMEREPQPQFASGPSEASAGHWEEEAEWEEDWGDEVVFPIEDYDDLRVAEILPLLPQLEPDELEDVRDREHNTKARATIIARIDELLGAGPEAPAQAPAPARSPAVRKATGGTTKTSGGKTVGGRTVAGKTVGGKVAGGRGAAAGAVAKRAATTGKAAASSGRTTTSSNRSASSNSAAPARSARSAGAPARAGSSSASATRSGAAQKASGTAGKAAAAGKAASAGKSAAGRGAPAPAPARAAAAGKATAAKKAAQSATKAASNKATQPVKKAAKKAGGDSTGQPRKR